MDAKTLAEAKADLEKLMDEAVESHEPVIIVREGKPAVVLIALAALRGEQETAHLDRSKSNRQRLKQSIADADRGTYAKQFTLGELEKLVKGKTSAGKKRPRSSK